MGVLDVSQVLMDGTLSGGLKKKKERKKKVYPGRPG